MVRVSPDLKWHVTAHSRKTHMFRHLRREKSRISIVRTFRTWGSLLLGGVRCFQPWRGAMAAGQEVSSVLPDLRKVVAHFPKQNVAGRPAVLQSIFLVEERHECLVDLLHPRRADFLPSECVW